MRKIILTLCAVFLTALGYTQGTETFTNISNATGDGNGYSNSYQGWTWTGDNGETWSATDARIDQKINDEAILVRDGELTTTILGGIGNLTLTTQRIFGGGSGVLTVTVDGSVVGTIPYSDTVQTSTIPGISVAGDAVLLIETPGNGDRIAMDDLIWTATGNAPTLTIIKPTNDDEFSPLETPTIEFNLSNFDLSTNATAADGDGYIQYQVDQDAFVDYFSTDAIVLTNLDAGEHTVTLQLVDNNGDVLTPEVNSAVTFTVNEITEVNNIDALRTSDLGGYYTLTEEVVLTYQQNFRGQKYIQDATGAILIDDNDGVLTKAYNQYDGITGISGKLQEHNGLKQFVPIIDADDATSTDNSVDIVVLSISDYMANPTDYESQIIAFENVHFTDADGTETFATGTNYDISDGSNSSIMRTNFYDADYIGEIIPEGTLPAISGIAAHFNGDGQIFPRDMNDLDGTTLSIKEFETATSIDIYPNPATDRFYVNVNSNAQVEVFSIIGKKVVHTQVADQNTPVSIQNLKSGVYIIKVTQDGATTTKKLIIK